MLEFLMSAPIVIEEDSWFRIAEEDFLCYKRKQLIRFILWQSLGIFIEELVAAR